MLKLRLIGGRSSKILFKRLCEKILLTYDVDSIFNSEEKRVLTMEELPGGYYS